VALKIIMVVVLQLLKMKSIIIILFRIIIMAIVLLLLSSTKEALTIIMAIVLQLPRAKDNSALNMKFCCCLMLNLVLDFVLNQGMFKVQLLLHSSAIHFQEQSCQLKNRA